MGSLKIPHSMLAGNVELGLSKGKEAVSMDGMDGTSWSLLGNAYLSHFFQVLGIIIIAPQIYILLQVSQNPKTLKQAMSSYSQVLMVLILARTFSGTSIRP